MTVKELNREYWQTLEDLNHKIEPMAVIEIMKVERLDRIAAALEKLAGCVDQHQGNRLYIAGEISNTYGRY